MESPWSTQTRARVQNQALIFQAAYNTTKVKLIPKAEGRGEIKLNCENRNNILFTVF